MLRFVICEDKQKDLERTRLAVNKAMVHYDIDYRVNTYTELTPELENFIKTNNDTKIYILDIELKSTSGIEVANIIRKYDWKSYIVVTTEYTNHKSEVFHFRLMIVDYISKGSGDYSKRLIETISTIYENIEKDAILDFNFGSRHHRILCNEIAYIEKEPQQTKCTIHLIDGASLSINTTLIQIKKKLTSKFYQSHQACIVNSEAIRDIDFSQNLIKLKNDVVISLLSERHKKVLRQFAKHS